jgi:hypothetical protein
MLVRVYVDGFNLYYRALRKSPYKWLNLLAFAREVLDPVDTIDRLRYFTARVSPRSGDPDAPKRQQAYLSALSGVPEISVHYGRFLPKEKWRPIVHPRWLPCVNIEVHDTEEKGSDVNLAAHLLNDGWRNQYEAALVMSQDTDLCEPLRMVSQEMGKIVGLVWLDGREPSRRLTRVTSFVRHATPARLAASQFPDPTRARNGDFITKPSAW